MVRLSSSIVWAAAILWLLSVAHSVNSTCYARSKSNYMIKLQTSLEKGARKVDYLLVNSLLDCKKTCCQDPSCDTSMYIGENTRVRMEHRVKRNCVLIHCGHSGACEFSDHHTGFTTTNFTRQAPRKHSTPPELRVVTSDRRLTTPQPSLASSARATPKTTTLATSRPTPALTEPTTHMTSGNAFAITSTSATTSSSMASSTTSSEIEKKDGELQANAVDVLSGVSTQSTNTTPAISSAAISTTSATQTVVAVILASSCRNSTTAADQMNCTTSPSPTSAAANGKSKHFFSSAPALVAALIFALLFTMAVLFMVARRWLGACRRPLAYQKADYLINGMYT